MSDTACNVWERIVIKRNKLDLKRSLKKTNDQLAKLNRELASQMILLASQTGDTAPLIQAVTALRSAQELYSADQSPRENAEIQRALGDTLLKLGRANHDTEALSHAVEAYRGAITLASLIGDDVMRRDLKKNYGLTRALLGDQEQIQGLFSAA
jgi:urease accessory protein UreF